MQLYINDIIPNPIFPPISSTFTASPSLFAAQPGGWLPVILDSSFSFEWNLRSQTTHWTSTQITTGSNQVSYELSASFTGEEPNTYRTIQQDVLELSVSRVGVPEISAVSSVYVVPVHAYIYSPKTFYTINEPVTIYNATQRETLQDIVSAFIWTDGITTQTTYDFDTTFTTSYSAKGTYDITVTVVTNDGQLFDSTFEQMYEIIDEVKMFRPDIERIFGVVDIELPYTLDEVKMPPNEWVTADNINLCIERLRENYTYLEKMTILYEPTPTELIGWFGNDKYFCEQWHVKNTVGNTNYDSVLNSEIGLLSAANDIRINQKDWYIIANDTTVQILSSDFHGTLISEISERAVGDTFGVIAAIDLDSRDKIYVLDTENLRIVVLEYDEDFQTRGWCGPWNVDNTWGTFGGHESRYGFRHPIDMFISKDIVYVLDDVNQVIKRYSIFGANLGNIHNSKFASGISLTVDIDDNIHVLCEDHTILKLNQAGEILMTITYPEEVHGTPRKIRVGYDGGFMYVCMEERVVKLTTGGIYAGSFAEFVPDIEQPFEMNIPRITYEDFSGTTLTVSVDIDEFDEVSIYVNGLKQTKIMHYFVDIDTNTIEFVNALQNDNVAVDIKHVLRMSDKGFGNVVIFPIALKNDDKTEVYVNGIRQTHMIDYQLLVDYETTDTHLTFREDYNLNEDHVAIIVRDPSSILYILPGRDYRNVYSHRDGRFYIANGESIIHYVDMISYYTMKTDTSKLLWDEDSLKIKKDEYVEAWVYNRIFARFFDNLEIFRRSLIFSPVIDISVEGIETVSIKPIIGNNLPALKNQKSDIYIGVNELVTPDVINRCLTQFYENQLELLDLINERTERDEGDIDFPLTPFFESRSVTAMGNRFILPNMPYNPQCVAVYINGLRQTLGEDYNVIGRIVELTFPYEGMVTIDYIYFASYIFTVI